MASPVSLPVPIQKQIEAIYEVEPTATPLALVWNEPLPQLNQPMRIRDVETRVIYCVSELAMREALLEFRDQNLVLISPFDEIGLAKDVLARLWKNRPKSISPWRTLQQLLKIKDIDPRLLKGQGSWMAAELLNSAAGFQQRIRFGEILDLESAWRALVLARLNYESASVDLPSLLEWSLRPDVPSRSAEMPSAMREHLPGWLAPSLAEMEPLVSNLIASGRADMLFPLAMACSVIYAESINRLVDPHLVLTSRGRFEERYLGDIKITPKLLKRFGDEAVKTAEKLIENGDKVALDASFGRAEQILASLDFLPAAVLSSVLPAGFKLRLSDYAQHLEQSILHAGSLERARTSLAQLKAHKLSGRDFIREQLSRADMALRLTMWLQSGPEVSGDIVEQIQRYLQEGAFVDWARSKIWSGDSHEGLNRVYQKLAARVAAVREQQNLAFAQHLPTLARGDLLPSRYVLVESAIENVLAPIAEKSPLLLIVLDGMSLAVYRELMQHLAAQGWLEIRESESTAERTLISAFPTITNVSRSSLLSGALANGNQNTEKQAFAAHPLLKRLARKSAPALWHKQDLTQQGSLSAEVRAAIVGNDHGVLGVVINAIDDQLSSSSQVTVNWSLETVKLLHQVLEAAKESDRAVIITSDHGHVLEHDSAYAGVENDGGGRYQTPGTGLRDKEILLKGARVLLPGNEVVVPWSETLRYTKKKTTGYHGGGSPQEVLIPLGVYVSGLHKGIPGWREVSPTYPEWWATGFNASTHSENVPVQKTIPTHKTTPSKAPAKVLIQDLFSETAPVGESRGVFQVGQPEWIARLFASPVYRQMLSRSGRTTIAEAELEILLRLLEQHGGQLMEAVLMRELQKPPMRIRGFLAGAQKLLNVEGYPILSVERESQTIRLNIADLKTQFEL